MRQTLFNTSSLRYVWGFLMQYSSISAAPLVLVEISIAMGYSMKLQLHQHAACSVSKLYHSVCFEQFIFPEVLSCWWVLARDNVQAAGTRRKMSQLLYNVSFSALFLSNVLWCSMNRNWGNLATVISMGCHRGACYFMATVSASFC